MLGSLLKKVLGSRNDRQLKKMGKLLSQINAQEAPLKDLDDKALQSKTDEFKKRIAQGETLDQLLPEAFAVAREASRRVMGMRHFDVQLIGGICLHQGKIAEMRTGEGKTLVATLPVYLNALSGQGVHVVTVNDYLAQRDANWMRPLYEFLGMSVGIVIPGQEPEVKKAAYASDITYGTNNEFGFDYLRDNMAFAIEDKFQRELNFAIIDEVDSILIDEARTPLIISGPAEDSSEMYQRINALIPELKRAEMIDDQPGEGHYTLDEKTRQVDMTEEGHQFVEERLQEMGLIEPGDSLYASANLLLLHHVYAALRAHAIFQRNVDYIVQNNQVVLVDEHTGRTMQGRRLSEGLHQALEAKEGVAIQPESQTLASTTFQNYFRLYNTLSGMTGTADTEAYEFQHIYGLEVLVIPTHKTIARKDHNDLVYLSLAEKYDAIIEDIKECSQRGQPVLVGTASIDSSELLSQALLKGGIRHEVLNAKFHEREAEIVAQAGSPGAVTIATNMAGRGTDIVLGGNFEAELSALDNPSEEKISELKTAWLERHDQVIGAGGLHIIGTERHESRRIDNQLRGRSGRQGDPGSSRFYLSMEDNLMRIFASERVKSFMQALGMEKGEAIEHRMVSNAIEKAQRKVEGRNFDIRKQLLEYDDVANDQRQVVYAQRNELMASEDVSGNIQAIREDVVDELVSAYLPPQSLPEQWDIAGLEQALHEELAVELPVTQWLEEDETLHEEGVRARILEQVVADYAQKEELAGSDSLRTFEKHILLRVLDEKWKEHLAQMDHLRQGIHLRGYAGKNPKQEYKREAFERFQSMLQSIKADAVKYLSHVQVRQQTEEEARAEQQRREALARQMEFQHAQGDALASSDENEQPAGEPSAQEPVVRSGRKVGRNETCPCGSGKKYKHCHGQIA